MAFVIATRSKYNKNELMFMADRTKTVERFWTLFIDDAFVFVSEQAAKTKASEFKFGNPRVMTLAEARIQSDKNTNNHSVVKLNKHIE